jgi:hypothetical protein
LDTAGHVIAHSAVQHVITSDMTQLAVQDLVKAFDTAIAISLMDDNFQQAEHGVFYLEYENNDPYGPMLVPTDAEYGDMITDPHPDVIEVDVYNKYLNAEFLIHCADGDLVCTRVAKRARADTGEWIGCRHTNPAFDKREYECVLDDSTIEIYTANVIAENLYLQCDSEGCQILVLDKIIDHAKDNTAVTIMDGYTTSFNGNRVPKHTTKGWKLLCQWRDGSSTLVSLGDLKYLNAIELAEYAVANKLQEEPAFKWWVSSVLRKQSNYR